jgi:hypothetical protein
LFIDESVAGVKIDDYKFPHIIMGKMVKN